MKIILYNTLTRKKEVFRPLHKRWVGLYTCGPTVYNYAHIGNLRTYIFEDILRRTLEYDGYKVRHVMNTTDVDDKTIKAASEAGIKLQEFTRRYEKIFKNDLARLNIKYSTKLVRATAHIPEMIRLIQKLLKKEFAYEKNGSVYFEISKFKQYGKLARLDKKGMKAGVRVDADEYTKNSVQDFALWKKVKDGEPYWKAPFGAGRPGWHIECSAMSIKYLGKTFDLHAAAVDLIFPHHENEIAQSEAATGKKFVIFWLHGEHLLVNGEKMSKSLGTIFTLRDIEERKFDPLALRYLALTSHYRSKLNFTWDSLKGADNSLKHLHVFVKKLQGENFRGPSPTRHFREQFRKALFNDLDTPKALSILWGVIRRYNKNPERFNTQSMQKLFFDFDKILGLGFKNSKAKKISAEIIQLIKKREELRSRKEWNAADEIRKNIYSKGFVIEDTEKGPILKSIE